MPTSPSYPRVQLRPNGSSFPRALEVDEHLPNTVPIKHDLEVDDDYVQDEESEDDAPLLQRELRRSSGASRKQVRASTSERKVCVVEVLTAQKKDKAIGSNAAMLKARGSATATKRKPSRSSPRADRCNPPRVTQRRSNAGSSSTRVNKKKAKRNRTSNDKIREAWQQQQEEFDALEIRTQFLPFYSGGRLKWWMVVASREIHEERIRVSGQNFDSRCMLFNKWAQLSKEAREETHRSFASYMKANLK